MNPRRCRFHDRWMVLADHTETVHTEGGREVFRPAAVYICPTSGCTEHRVVTQ